MDKDTHRTQGLEIMKERFGTDALICVATSVDNIPAVRTVNGHYEEGAFYIITYAISNKMQQIAKNPVVAVCGEWFTGRGMGENLGYVKSQQNLPLFERLKDSFSAWYSNGHVNEEDPDTCILRIRMTEGTLFHHGTRFDIDFTSCFPDETTLS